MSLSFIGASGMAHLQRHLAEGVKADKYLSWADVVGDGRGMTHEASISNRCGDVSGELATWQPLGSYEPQSQRNYDRDLYECEREAIFAGGDNKQQVFDNCMKAKGYKEK
jgi:hypothetical protein